MTLDVSGVEAGTKKAEAAFDGVSASAEKTGEQSERSFDALLAPLERISKQLSQMGAHLSELTGLSRQNGVALAELGNQLSNIGTAAVKAEKGTDSAGKALKETEEDALDFAAAAVRSDQRVAELSQELQNLTDHKKVLEQNGLGLGFWDYDQTVARIQELKAALKEYQASLSKPISVRAEGLNNLTAQLKQAKADLKSLEGAGFGLGDANYDAQYQEIMRLTAAVKEYKASLAQAEQEPPRLGERLMQAGRSALSLGRNLASAVGGTTLSGFRRLGSLLGNIGSRLLGVGRSAESSNLGLTKMVRSIRNISLVSAGMKLVGALFGRLRSVVNQYLSENQAAQAAVNNLRSAFANALAPAINIAINALSAILPYIQAVSNAFATLFANLFGAKWTTISGGAAAMDSVADATEGATAAQEEYNRTLAGFDQITKLDDNSSSGGSGGGGGGTSASTTGGGPGMLGQFSQFMTDLADMVKNGAWADLGNYLAESFGSAVDQLYDLLTSETVYDKIDNGITALGTTVNSFFARMTLIDDETGDSIAEKTGMTLGAALNLAFYTVNTTLTSINWGQIGLTIAQLINGAVEETDFSQIGATVANWFLTLPKILTSTIIDTDWKVAAAGLSDALTSAFGTISDWVKSVDWSKTGTAIEDALSGVDWGGIATSAFDLLGSAFGGLGSVIGQLIADAFDGISRYFDEKTQEAGGDVILGVLKGITDGLSSIGAWIRDNIFSPFIAGFKSAFGIHSPASAPELVSAAQNVGQGILNGIASVFSDASVWVQKNILAPISNALGNVALTVSAAVSLTKKGWTSLGSFIGNAITVSISLAKKGWSSLGGFVGNAVSAAVSLVKKGWTSLSSFVGTSATLSAGIKLVKKGWTSLSSFIGSLTKSIGLTLSWKTSGLSSLQKAVAKVLFGSAKWPTLKFAARGGIVDRATLLGGNLVAGEAGAEAIIPLENHTEWLDKVADRLAQRVSTGSTAGTNRPIIVQVALDGRVVGQTAVDYAIGVANTTGQLPWAAYT